MNLINPSLFKKWSGVFLASIIIPVLSCSSSDKKEEPAVNPAVKKEVQVGRSLAAKLAKKYGLIRDVEFTSYINSIGLLMASYSSRPELSFRFGILNTNEVNAFACPGGYVLITKGALSRIENEAELAALLSHELSHVTLKHSGSFEEDKVGFLDVLAAVMAPGGDVVSSFTKTVVDRMYSQFFEKGRKQEEEMDSDKAGVIYMIQAGYNPEAAITYLNKLNNSPENETLLKTHPPVKERITALSNFFKEQKIALTGKTNKERYQNEYKAFLSRNP